MLHLLLSSNLRQADHPIGYPGPQPGFRVGLPRDQLPHQSAEKLADQPAFRPFDDLVRAFLDCIHVTDAQLSSVPPEFSGRDLKFL
jgi:hypothetical protein